MMSKNNLKRSNKRHCTNAPPPQIDKNKPVNTTAVFGVNQLWTNVYPYDSTFDPIQLDVQFIDNPSCPAGSSCENTSNWISWKPWEKAWVARVITNSIMKCANIKFIFHINDNNLPNGKTVFDIRISRLLNQGCYSYIGTDSLTSNNNVGASINFGWMDAPLDYTFTYNGISYTTDANFNQGGYSQGAGSTIIHEFCHAVGMYHELQSPFNNTLIFNSQNTLNYFSQNDGWLSAQTNTNVLDLETASSKNGSTFDQYSIMKYSLPACLLTNGSIKQGDCANFIECSTVNGLNANTNNDCANFINQENVGFLDNNVLSQNGGYIQQFNDGLSPLDCAWLATNYPNSKNINVPNYIENLKEHQKLKTETDSKSDSKLD